MCFYFNGIIIIEAGNQESQQQNAFSIERSAFTIVRTFSIFLICDKYLGFVDTCIPKRITKIETEKLMDIRCKDIM